MTVIKDHGHKVSNYYISQMDIGCQASLMLRY